MNTRALNPGKGFRTALALAILAALQANGACAAPGPGQLAAPTRLSPGDAVIGALPMATPIHVVVGLKLRDRQALEAFVQEGARTAAEGGSPRLMTRDEALARYAPTRVQAQAVADFLASRGFSNVTISPSRMLVSADGTAQTARDAFMTSFAQVRTGDGRFAYANTDAVRLPAALSGTVDSVLGLQNVHVPHSFAVRADPGGGAHTMDITTHSPTDFPAIYSVGTAAAATGVPVGIVTEGKLAQVKMDLNHFTTAHGLPTVTTTTVNTGGTSTDTTHISDWDLASQDIVAMAGGVQQLVFYNIPDLSDASLTQDFDTIQWRDEVKIIEVPFGECEQYVDIDTGDAAETTDDAIFLLAAAQGQTFSVANGNIGADECGTGANHGTYSPSYPASSPWVVAVAGTRLSTTGTSWAGEQVWKDSGGSISVFELTPLWQQAFGLPARRAVADVAFDADPNSGASIYVNGALQTLGGTGLSSSLFAGLWARVLQAHPGIGFAGPFLYALPKADFHDIVYGKNSGGEPGVGYKAAAGYDFASGRGSMKIGPAVNGMAGRSQQLLHDTGFENPGSTAWLFSDPSTLVNDAATAHAGSWHVVLGGGVFVSNTLQQRVTIPAGKKMASVRFYVKTTTADPKSNEDDSLIVEACSERNCANQYPDLGFITNQDGSANSGSYVLRGFDASPMIGKTFFLRLVANSGNNVTTWDIDDVTVVVE